MLIQLGRRNFPIKETQLESGLKSLSKLFTERLLRIPDYQRGYSWKGKQLKEFWSDIEQLETDHHHYLGVLTLEAVQPKISKHWTDDEWLINAKSFIPFHVVDGQQRLTTIVILLQCITEQMKVDEKLNYSSREDIQSKYIFIHKDSADGSFLFGYEKDNPSYECLKTKILHRSSSRYTAGESTIYTKNLVNAKAFFKDSVGTLDKHKLEQLFSKVTQHLLFNVFNIEKEVDVHVAFETMNNRGLPLSNLELLKNRLIYLTTRLGESAGNIETLRRTINDSWKTVYYFLGKNPGASLSDDYFLQVHFLVYFSREIIDGHSIQFENSLHRVGELHKAFLLEDRFTLRRLYSTKPEERVTSATLYHYAMDLKRVVEIYYQTNFPEDSPFSSEEKLWLSRLRRLIQTSHSREIFVLLLLLLPKQQGESTRLAILQSLESYFFLTSVVTYRVRKKTVELPMGAAVLSCAAGRTSLTEVVARIDSKIKAFKADSSQAEAILEGLAERGFYDWRELRYFMYEYECHLKLKSRRKSDKIDWSIFIEDNGEDHESIEHILPQTPSDPYWKDRLKGYTPAQIKKITNSLGNLVATSIPRNSSLRNRSFHEKVGASDRKVSYKFGSYSEIEVALSLNWGPEEILQRGLTLIDFISERWGIYFTSEKTKRKQLGLDFAIPPITTK